jgi:AhpD family alkylhydroperoxidase
MEFRTERLPNASSAVQQRVLRSLLGLGLPPDSGLEPELLELVKMRASQINGCAFCLDMHTKDARAMGESEQRLYLLSAWRDQQLQPLQRGIPDACRKLSARRIRQCCRLAEQASMRPPQDGA